MDNATLRVVILAVVALVALACIVRGAHLIRKGDKADSGRLLLLWAGLIMLAAIALLFLQS